MGKALTKDLVQAIASKKNLTLKDAEQYVDAFFAIVGEGLQKDKVVKVKGFGTFKLVDVRDRESVDVNTGERVTIGGHTKVTFTPDATLRDMVNKPFSQFETVVINDGVDVDAMFQNDAPDGNEDNAGSTEAETDETTDSIATDNPEQDESIEEKSPKTEAPRNNIAELAAEAAGMISSPAQAPAKVPSSEGETSAISMENMPESSPQPSTPYTINEEFGEDVVIDTGDSIEQTPVMESSSPIIETSSPIDNSSTIETSSPAENSTETVSVAPTASSEAAPSVAPKVETEQASTVRVEVPQDEDSDEDDDEPTPKKSGTWKKVLLAGVMIVIVAAGFFAGYYFGESKHMTGAMTGAENTLRQHPPFPVDNPMHHPHRGHGPHRGKDAVENSVMQGKDGPQPPFDAQSAPKPDAPQPPVNQQNKDDAAVKQKEAQNAAAQANAKATSKDQQKADKADAEKTANKSLGTASRVVQTGAYRIVGTSQTYKVKQGETMKSIARRLLGDGMECYIQVHNGKSEVQAGESLRIPKLEIKKKGK